jgi:hypothetical protein
MSKDYTTSISPGDAIPIEDDRGLGQPIREAMLIERQWDRVMMAGSKNLLDYQNRAEFKSSVLMIAAYLNDVLANNVEYQAAAKEIYDDKSNTVQDEIRKTFKLVKIIKSTIRDNSTLFGAEIIDVEDDGTYD